MTEQFKDEIKAYAHPLFYNSTGSTEAYKLCVRHLSAAMSAGLARLEGGYMYPKELLHLVDLENEKIVVKKEPIKLIKLEELA